MKLSILLLFILINFSEQWLSIIQITNISYVKQDLCLKKYGFNHRQIHFCRKNQHLMPFIHFGTRLALDECQIQFKNRHWNCTLFHNNQLIGNILDSGTKESAYIHALTSAGIAYAITKACSTGRIHSCGCDMTIKDKNKNSSIRWTECSDNILFGTQIARKFVNLREYKIKSQINLLNLHNNQIGIRTILSSIVRQCKCHGISGSCELKSCWYSLNLFTKIANQLKEFYDNSIEIYKEKQFLSIEFKNNLIFLNSSPNYCERNLSLGSFGTIERICNRSSRAIDSCDLLCCNRGYQSHIVTRNNQCNCHFQWCCHVQCQNCVTTHEISRCL